MISFVDVTAENIRKHNTKWPQVLDHPYKILIIGGSGSGKINALLNLIIHQPDIDKIYFFPKEPYETKNQLLISKCKRVGLKHRFECGTYIEYWNDMDNIYENIDECNPNKKCKILIVYDDMTVDMLFTKKT